MLARPPFTRAAQTFIVDLFIAVQDPDRIDAESFGNRQQCFWRSTPAARSYVAELALPKTGLFAPGRAGLRRTNSQSLHRPRPSPRSSPASTFAGRCASRSEVESSLIALLSSHPPGHRYVS
jgi:hypothetical protein